MSAANRKRRIGQVVSDKMDKTVVVAVQWRQRHPVYRKSIRRISKFHAHDEQNDARIGDRVLIVETKPLSRLKRWRIAEILERREVPEIAPQEIGAEIEEEIAQPEAAVAAADAPQAETADTAGPEVAVESEQEAAEEPEREAAGEAEREAAGESEQERMSLEEAAPQAEEPGSELELPDAEATVEHIAEAGEPSADEAPSQDAPSTGQEPEAEASRETEEEIGRAFEEVEEKESKERP